MPRFQKPTSLNDSNPILKPNHIHDDNEMEFHKMVEHHDTVIHGGREEEEEEEEEAYVTVTAPSNLPSGYELIVESMDGSFWTIQVPHGGVTMNETFCAKVLHKTQVAKAKMISGNPRSSSSKTDPLMMSSKNPSQQQDQLFDIPTGRWRDGIFDCCIMPLHPIFFATYCFPLITLGQVMTRIRFNICGGCETGGNRSRHIYPRAFYVMLAITVVKLLFFSNLGKTVNMMYTMDSPGSAYDPYLYSGSNTWSNSMWYDEEWQEEWENYLNSTDFEDDFWLNYDPYSQSSGSYNTSVNVSVHYTWFRLLASMAISIYILVVHTKTRNSIRRAYSIGSDMSCIGDCCCAWWCAACSICQMARHTANYHNTHRARCCTPNGLDEEWDEYDFLPTSTQNDRPQSRSTLPMMV